jgi:biopolymer transport protein TolR
MATFFSRRRTRPAEEAETGELNIVPYLDILMNLILFMLLSMAGLATFGVLKVDASAADTKAATRELTLTVAIANTGFIVRADDATAPIPRLADGAYDFTSLRTRMAELKAAHPSEQRGSIAAAADTDYETLIATLDATRETVDRRALFPQVTLSR